MLKPLRDKIIVKPIPRIQSTIFVQSAEADSVGFVVAAGPDAIKEGLNVGDKVYFGTLAKDYGDEYLKFEPIEIDGQRHQCGQYRGQGVSVVLRRTQSASPQSIVRGHGCRNSAPAGSFLPPPPRRPRRLATGAPRPRVARRP